MQTQCPPPSRDVTFALCWSWLWGWAGDAGLRTYCEPAVSLLLEQFLQPLPSLGCGAEALSWLFFSYQRNLLCTQSRWQIPGPVTILYLDHSGIGDLHWSSFSSRSVNLPVDPRAQPPGLQSLLSWPLASPATPSKLSHFWKLPFSHLQNSGKNGCSFIELMEGLNNFRALNLAHNHFCSHLIFSSICWITSRSQPLFFTFKNMSGKHCNTLLPSQSYVLVGTSESTVDKRARDMSGGVCYDEDTVQGHREQCWFS